MRGAADSYTYLETRESMAIPDGDKSVSRCDPTSFIDVRLMAGRTVHGADLARIYGVYDLTCVLRKCGWRVWRASGSISKVHPRKLKHQLL